MITTVKKLLTNLSHLAKDKKAWLALIAGLFLTLSYAPYNLWFITFLSLGALLYCINPLANGKLAAKQSAKYGFLFGLGWFGAGISWVHVALCLFSPLSCISYLAGNTPCYRPIQLYMLVTRRYRNHRILTWHIANGLSVAEFWLYANRQPT